MALCDLTSKKLEIESTVRIARDHGWLDASNDFQSSEGSNSGDPPSITAGRRDQLLKELHDARARVQAWSEPDGSASGERASSSELPPRRGLLDSEIEALDRVENWLETARSSHSLGKTFLRALARDKEESLASGVIGRPGGLAQAEVDIRALIAACDRLQTEGTALPTGTQPLSGVERLQRIAAMVDSADQLQKLAAELPSSFFQRLVQHDESMLRDLLAAFNELLTFMTPARWNYRDILLRPQTRSAQLQGDPETRPASIAYETPEGARADLLFNTAELNLSALALFLLLAPRLPNPLRMLILDDPLQNMDELTVITVSRAIGKLLWQDGAYPSGWQILAFFHGEENVERMREETQAVVYQLPWLHSLSEDSGDVIKPIDALSMWPSKVQILDKTLLEDRGGI